MNAAAPRHFTAVHAAYEWPWKRFVGNQDTLRYAKNELANLERVLPYVKGRSVCVQAGGNLGVFPKFLSNHFLNVYTFEPDAWNFMCMTINAPELNITRFQAALGDTRSLVGISRTRRDGKSNVHDGVCHVSGSGSVPMMRLDDLPLRHCDLLYLDVEGSELLALGGALRTLKEHKPVVVAEINHCLQETTKQTPDSFIAWVEACGYRHETTFGSDHVFLPTTLPEAA